MRWMTTASATARFQSKSRSASAAEAVPANEGLMRPIKLIAPPGTIVNALPPAAVAGGNVETSQRIVDVLFRALAHAAPERIPAASSGSMSNVTVGGYDTMRARHFSYYETIAGGAGAAPNQPGASGIHTHMTNTLNTPIEALEAYYPLRITEYRGRRRRRGRRELPGAQKRQAHETSGQDERAARARRPHSNRNAGGRRLGPREEGKLNGPIFFT